MSEKIGRWEVVGGTGKGWDMEEEEEEEGYRRERVCRRMRAFLKR